MFWQIYKTTKKNILRSGTFWMLLVVFVYITFDIIIHHWYSYYSFEYREMIIDTDPRFVLDFETYVKTTYNVVLGKLNFFLMPLFACVSTVLVLNRDYGDNFYEIEKGAGVKPGMYLLGRIVALVTLNFAIAVIAAFGFFHLYMFTRGGIPSMDLWTYITDSTIRIMRNIVFYAMPGILFYIGFTYFLGCFLRNETATAFISIGYALFYATSVMMLRIKIPQVYFDYLSPSPSKLGHYLYAYDSDQFNSITTMMNTDLGKATLCVCILVGLFIFYSVISYLRTCKRDR